MTFPKHLGDILLIDNDALVNIFCDLRFHNSSASQRVITFLLTRFTTIWIPGVVLNEFYIKKGDKQRQKILKPYLENEFLNIEKCPLSVGEHELTILVGSREENRGEADALIQIQKAQAYSNFHFRSIQFLTNDRGAMNMARNLNIEIYPYRELRNTMREIGITLPG
ncbi:MAG: hypothetical protein AAFR59_14495 [Bacteroidota bacterium]